MFRKFKLKKQYLFLRKSLLILSPFLLFAVFVFIGVSIESLFNSSLGSSSVQSSQFLAYPEAKFVSSSFENPGLLSLNKCKNSSESFLVSSPGSLQEIQQWYSKNLISKGWKPEFSQNKKDLCSVDIQIDKASFDSCQNPITSKGIKSTTCSYAMGGELEIIRVSQRNDSLVRSIYIEIIQ